MSATLPEPLAAYFAAKNRHDIDAMLAPFAAHAVVEDEGQERRGLASFCKKMRGLSVRRAPVRLERGDGSHPVEHPEDPVSPRC